MNLTRTAIGIVAVAALASGCGEDGEPDKAAASTPAASTPPSGARSTPSPTGGGEPGNDLRNAVQAYSDAFLSGEPTASYDLLSARCRDRHSLSYWTGVITAASDRYGEPLPIKSYAEKVSGDMARVTYTYSVAEINQTDEPWVNENGWKNDDC
ncbi:hypothetical protein [Pimelobacter simplex]|uniref:hypothetical protein n=1 Tax=Nocardioides simplex TaxID=2045 RepID=UPI00214FCBE1|nr:hypothetical protein [Pimelobacter simplex]UUW89383.1 hypothetical protein M0M43_27185 [Pimelobacter simplex]UUW93211.1 hypothetical protein M0M48_15835 [Pimelobacter simplex]